MTIGRLGLLFRPVRLVHRLEGATHDHFHSSRLPLGGKHHIVTRPNVGHRDLGARGIETRIRIHGNSVGEKRLEYTVQPNSGATLRLETQKP